jgi:enoyl-CoA hydratase
MSDVVVSTENGVGRITLNRPKALHALTTAMCEAIVEALDMWRLDPAIVCVLLEHGEGRGFCAGGDIRMLAESGAGDAVDARAFFHVEYQMNHLLFSYGKPIVVFMDGITMGGGVGLALPCMYRVATEQTRLAMPETGIGLFPDVGGGWYLPRLPGETGKWLALTGARLNGADCMQMNMATHYILSDNLPPIKQAILEDPANLKTILNSVEDDVPLAPISGMQSDIDRLFSGNTLERILADLAEDPSDWAAGQLALLKTKSLQSCKIALRQLKAGLECKSFEKNMETEYAIASRIVQSPDFIEGVRAVIVDKDNAPKWIPASPELMSGPMIDTFFAPLPTHDAWRPYRER